MEKQPNQNPSVTTPPWIRKSFELLEFISPYLASKLANLLFFTPIRFRVPKKELGYLKAAKTKTIAFKKNKVKIYEWGNAEKGVLLVHGWSGRATQVAHLTNPLLEAGFKVYSFDAPAHGNSNGRHSHFLEFSELIFELKKRHQDIEYIVGHSMGGSACIHAISQGLQIKKCVSIASPSNIDWVLNSFCTQINVSTKVEKRIKKQIETKFNAKFEEFSVRTLVKKVSLPGLIIHCKDDQDTPFKAAQEIHQNWKNSTLVFTKKLGHRRILKDKEFAQTIIDFLKS